MSDRHEDRAPGAAGGLLARMRAMPNDEPRKIVFVAVALCLVCSVLVAGAAVVLKPVQNANKALDRKKNVLEVAGMLGAAADIEDAFARIEARVVDLDTGEFADDIDAASFDQRKAARDPERSVAVPAERDIAGIKRRARHARVYVVRDGDAVSQIILPVHGYGLWSTLYGYLSLEGDFRTVKGLKFYEHAETPGLGGEVDNPDWLAQWPGKVAFDDEGDVEIEVIKGTVDPGREQAKHRVDGLAGATLTSRGITHLVRYWLGEDGFGPFLDRLREQKG